jgi:hypothetical protein
MSNSSIIPVSGVFSPIPDTIASGQSAVPGPSFLQYIWKKKANRRRLLIALTGMILQFVIFKFLYPFPDFFSDSYSYIYAAYAHLDVSIWPIGYSKFLAAFHTLTHSDTALVAFQYLFLELAALYFYFTILFLFHADKATRITLFVFLFFNPLFLYLSNYVSSDSLFAALSLWWLSELVWIINRPRLYQVFTQGVLLFLCFTFRNNAYYYPFIAVAAFLLSCQRPLTKLTGCLFGPLLILPFVLHTRAITKEITGTAQYSLFTGWQLANNALYIRDKVQIDTARFPSVETSELDLVAREFFRKIPHDVGFRDYLESSTGNFYIIRSDAPLREFARTYAHKTQGRHEGNNPVMEKYSGAAAWGRASSIFAQYGIYLIRTHPLAFARYFLLPNMLNYFLPPLEKLEVYNLGLDNIPPSVADWFGLPETELQSVSKRAQGGVLYIYPFLFLWLNIQVLASFGWFFVSKQYQKLQPGKSKTLLLAGLFWIANFSFTLLATINVFRYQVVPMILYIASSLLLLEQFAKKRSTDTNTFQHPPTVINAVI